MEELDENLPDVSYDSVVSRKPPSVLEVLEDRFWNLHDYSYLYHRPSRSRIPREIKLDENLSDAYHQRRSLSRPGPRIRRGIIDDQKGHLLILVRHRLRNCFRCYLGSKGKIPVFLCRTCRFTLHVGCAVPQVATSKHHRHPLSYADFYVEDDSGEYYCDNCEAQRNPMLPVYRCLEGNCRFVAHFDCVFSECRLSIAHKRDYETSTLLIINPVLTAAEILKSIAEEEATKLEVEAAKEKHARRVVTVVANRGGERLSETLELVEEVKYMADNSWNEYDNQTLDDDCALSDDELDLDWPCVDEDYVNEKWVTAKQVELQKHTNESSLSEEPLRGITTLEGKEKIEFIQECHIVKEKIEAFIVQNLPIRSLSSCAHKHRMTIYDEKNTGGVPCSGCKLPTLESPFYGCTLCKFFLHRTCAELPQRIRCILHDHDLNLRQFGSSLHLSGEDVSDEICCFMCDLPIWGSTYHCSECKLYLHKLCVQLPLEIQHSLHPRHPLYLDLGRETDRTCNACGQQWRGCAYTCERCKFCLEVRCIYLKPTIRSTNQSLEDLLTLVEERPISHVRACYKCGENLHERGPFLYCMQWRISFHVQCSLPSTNTSSTHRHSLTLTDSYMEDCSLELYCDNCEKQRHPNHPIYLCRECGYVAHISCENYEMC